MFGYTLIKKDRLEQLEEFENCMDRFSNIYWLSEFKWLTEPFRHYVIDKTRPENISRIRDIIKINFREEYDNLLREIELGKKREGILQKQFNTLIETIIIKERLEVKPIIINLDE